MLCSLAAIICSVWVFRFGKSSIFSTPRIRAVQRIPPSSGKLDLEHRLMEGAARYWDFIQLLSGLYWSICWASLSVIGPKSFS